LGSTAYSTSTSSDRIHFTAKNLVGSLLLHWVLGITFMLFVTVSVLQLREVLHPDIFASVIRPQEPHPDLLGSLLQESGLTHARRMVMSLAIYLVLLLLFVWLPTYAFKAAIPSELPVQLRLFYIVPQIQVGQGRQSQICVWKGKVGVCVGGGGSQSWIERLLLYSIYLFGFKGLRSILFS
jgi:hypothetical protein